MLEQIKYQRKNRFLKNQPQGHQALWLSTYDHWNK